ncbi:basement membrane-specific heparan sulfate proteoglycan core protein-like [Argopecten irradians]|uniref:basement membrane-specific heparan sulfate proteoglycan core protein-like n=1 Tax=Argopecten irradians TaxID=31199 RepID=UPI00370FEADB
MEVMAGIINIIKILSGMQILILMMPAVLSQGIPTVVVPDSTYSVISGSSVTLRCVVSANPPVDSIQWRSIKGGNVSNIDVRLVAYIGGTPGTPALTIVTATAADSASYICTATNSVGTGVSGTTTLVVTGAVPTVTIPANAYTVITGQSITIVCAVTANPTASRISWSKTVGTVTSTLTIDNTKFTGGNIQTPSLTINNAGANDEAMYKCSATNVVGSATSNAATLDVTGAVPNVQVAQTSYSVLKGGTITLVCTLTGAPPATSVVWKRTSGGTETAVSTTLANYSGSTVSTPSLTITGAASVDAATYVCTATNSVGDGRSGQTSLSVTGDVPTVTVPDPTYSIVSGNSVTLRCSVSANPPIDSILWRKVKSGVTTNVNVGLAAYTGGTIGTPALTIVTATAADSAGYVCTVTNSVGTGVSGTTTLAVTGAVPAVSIPLNAYTVITGQSITIVCAVTANPTASRISWSKTVGTVTSTLTIDNTKFTGGNIQTPSLTINNAGANDEATYKCSATNVVGSATSNAATLDVTGGLPTVTITSPPPITAVVGSSVTLTCTVVATPQASSVTWKRTVGGVTSNIATTTAKFSGSTVANPSLTINSIATTDQGSYVCTATNAVGTGESSPARLAVTGAPPTATVTQTNYNINLGDSVTIACNVAGVPAVTSVSWTITKAPSTISTPITIAAPKYSGGSVTTPSLTISSAALTDQGTYNCKATNSLGTGTSPPAYVSVVGSSPIVSVPISAFSVDRGGQVVLPCNVVADPSATSVYWTSTVSDATNQITAAAPKYEGSSPTNPSLTIKNLVDQDQGSYRCHATNSVGTGQSELTNLVVFGAPIVNVPQDTYATVIGGNVTLACIVSSSTAFLTSVYWERLVNCSYQQVQINTNGRYSGGTASSPSFVISNAQTSDAGTYRCIAANQFGAVNSQTTLLVVTGKLKIAVSMSDKVSVHFRVTCRLSLPLYIINIV